MKTTPTRAAAKKAAPRLVVDSDSEEEVVKPQPKSRAKKAIVSGYKIVLIGVSAK